VERVLTILLAGGAGERLAPLTLDEPKPMMPFGGIYRLIDVTLSNCVNSGLTRIFVLTQYKALSLNRHIREAWNILSPELGQFIEAVPPTRRLRDTWYLGTADAVYQNIESLEDEKAPYTLFLSADQVYKMNYQHMLDWHIERGADVTVATTQVKPDEAFRFGIVNLGESFRITGFDEKPTNGRAQRSPFNPDACSASMGVYLFTTSVLLEALLEDAGIPDSTHDFGCDILPKLMGRRRVAAYDFVDENREQALYWRDVGTLDAYYEANMDLVEITPTFNLYDVEWPIRTSPSKHPPAKFVFAEEGSRTGVALASLVSHGCIISGGRVVRSVLSPGVRVNSHCVVENCVVFPNVVVGRHSRLRCAIVAQNVRVPAYTEVGFNLAADMRAGHFVTDSGLVVIHRDSPGVEPSISNGARARLSVMS
jgi:glucose-1-phosphate adenylyltransferase